MSSGQLCYVGAPAYACVLMHAFILWTPHDARLSFCEVVICVLHLRTDVSLILKLGKHRGLGERGEFCMER